MTGVWQARPREDAEDAPCQRCGRDVHLAHDPPCPHGLVACPECGWPAVCRDCKRNEELEAWAANIAPPHDLDNPDTRPPSEVYAEMAADVRRRQAELEAIREGDRAAWLRYKQWSDGRAEGEG